jgi:pilus assembly protein Flp/PilA
MSAIIGLSYWYLGSSNPRRKGVREMLFLPREEGQGLVEYALILVLVAIVVIAILLLVGPAVGNVFSTIVSAI